MPFNLGELAALGLGLRDLCLGLIELAYPISRPNITDDYAKAMLSISSTKIPSDVISEEHQIKMWTYLFKVHLPFTF